MEPKEKVGAVVSSQTHLHLRCLPHATGISSNSYITIAIRSLFTSPLHETPTLLPNVSTDRSGSGNGHGNGHEDGSDLSSSPPLGIIYHGTQFRIEATVTGIGGPLHSTPVGTVASSVLKKNGTGVGTGSGSGGGTVTNNNGDHSTATTTSSIPPHQGENQSFASQPHHNTHATVNVHAHAQAQARSRAQQQPQIQPQVTSTHSCYWEGSSNGNILVLPVRYKDVQRGSCIRLKLLTTRDRVVGEALFPLWDALGVLKTGLHRILIDIGGAGNGNGNGSGSGSGNESDRVKGRDKKYQGSYCLETKMDTKNNEEGWEEKDEKWEASLILDKLHRLKEAELNTSNNARRQMVESASTTTTTAGQKHVHAHARGGTSATHSNQHVNVDASLALQGHTNTYGVIESVPWLDAFTKSRCLDILHENISDLESSGDGGGGSGGSSGGGGHDHNTNTITRSMDILGNDRYATLIVELPDCNIPIVHQEVLYTMGHQGASGSVTALDLSLYHHERKQYQPQRVGQGSDGDSAATSGKVFMPDPIRYSTNDPNELNLKLVQILDLESPDSNPVEDKYRTLQHELIRGLVDPALKPDASERSRLNTIISGTSQHLTREEKDLLWRFRFSLVDNRRALTKFLLAVEWGVESEVVQAAELLEQWRKRSPIEVSDALKLLGKNVAFQTGLVRAYAIDTLAAAPDAELVLYLLQLVQALKYEHDSGDNGSGGSSNSSRNSALKMRGVDSKKRSEGTSSLSAFLIDRASRNLEFANYLYWYLKVELGDSSSSSALRYRDVFYSMKTKLTSVMVGQRTMWDVLSAQDKFISNVMDCQRKSRDAKGKKDAKEQHLKDSLKSPQCQSIGNDQSVPLPSNPIIWIKGVKAESAKMFKSAMYPALLDFHVDNKSTSNPIGPATVKISSPTYKVIVKTGDDLRQDQLVIMLIKLFDRILKRGALDLCLKPYPIMAMSQDTGLVEFVEGSLPVSQILANYNNSILSFFKSVAPSQGAKYDIEPKVMQTYIRSCAGYCVITYLIGVGDRHLDNLLITKRGHFFHIDFGFIFGRDPKPLPPLFRLTREMVDGMGGIESNEYRQFCSLACQTFNLLRKRAGLVLNLLHLMSDAGIEDLSNNPHADAEGVIAKFEERFRLELNDEQAETYFLGLINETLAAIAPRVMDVFHQIAVARR